MTRMIAGLMLSMTLVLALTGCSGDHRTDPSSSPSPAVSSGTDTSQSAEDGLGRIGEDAKDDLERAADGAKDAADQMKDRFDEMVDDGTVD